MLRNLDVLKTAINSLLVFFKYNYIYLIKGTVIVDWPRKIVNDLNLVFLRFKFVFWCNLLLFNWVRLGIYLFILSFTTAGMDYGLLRYNINCNKCLLIPF